jgi:hypothetical protein
MRHSVVTTLTISVSHYILAICEPHFHLRYVRGSYVLCIFPNISQFPNSQSAPPQPNCTTTTQLHHHNPALSFQLHWSIYIFLIPAPVSYSGMTKENFFLSFFPVLLSVHIITPRFNYKTRIFSNPFHLCLSKFVPARFFTIRQFLLRFQISSFLPVIHKTLNSSSYYPFTKFSLNCINDFPSPFHTPYFNPIYKLHLTNCSIYVLSVFFKCASQ